MMKILNSLLHFVHRNFLWVILTSYLLATLLPLPGQAMRDVAFGHLHLPHTAPLRVSLPLLMLSLLLFNAGLGIKTEELKHLRLHTPLLVLGLLANLLIPVAFAFVVSHLMSIWHNPDEVQNILAGLALIAAMPIAASSTAWAQKSEGNLTLSLGLVALSTLLSPLVTPVGLHIVGHIAAGDYSEDLHELAQQGTGLVLTLTVLLPALVGALIRTVVGEARLKPILPVIKIITMIDLLLLNYSNAALVLPQTFHRPDWDFLLVTLLLTSLLCMIAFAVGWLIPHWFRAGTAEKAALMFGLGMNNNGTGLVIASLAMADHPRILLPIILYNIVQQVIAGVVDRRAFPPASSSDILVARSAT